MVCFGGGQLSIQFVFQIGRFVVICGEIGLKHNKCCGFGSGDFLACLFVYLTTEIMLSILKMGGFKTGGTNFDAKVRRESFEPVDLFYAHIGGMDAFARGLKVAAAIREDGRLGDFIRQRYSSWDTGIGAKIESGKSNFRELEAYMLQKGEVSANTSGRQVLLENIINELL